MAKKGRDTRTKRQLAPAFWDIKRKQGQFIVNSSPGGHPKSISYPLGILLRDILKISNTMKESEKITKSGMVKVDGITRYDVNFPVGLMDIVELQNSNQVFRLVPKNSRLLYPIEIDTSEKNLKLLKIKNKMLVKGNKLQYGFHDGKTMILTENYNVDDSVLIDLSDRHIKNNVKIETNSLGMIIKGDNAGLIGKIDQIKEGNFSIPKRVILSLESRHIELPVNMVMTIGNEQPLIKVS